jgi:endonuclease III
MTHKDITNRLVKHGQKHMRLSPRITTFTGVKEYDALLNDLERFPHAFVIACVMDRQIKAELAWAIPYKLKERIGDFEFTTLYNLSKKQAMKHLNSPSPLHRFPEIMSECLYSVIQVIGDKYGGDASLIWSDTPSSADVIYRFLQIHGVGPKIATMATNILARNFKIKFNDYYSIDISADVHVKRVFHRLGLTEKSPSTDEVIYKARALHPEFPGLLDFPCWEVGRRWCRPKNTLCQECYLGSVCPSYSG